MTARMIIEALDKYFFLKSEVIHDSKGRKKTLVYRSPSGVELFRVELRLSEDTWKFSSLTHTLSSQVHELQDLCEGEESYAS